MTERLWNDVHLELFKRLCAEPSQHRNGPVKFSHFGAVRRQDHQALRQRLLQNGVVQQLVGGFIPGMCFFRMKDLAALFFSWAVSFENG